MKALYKPEPGPGLELVDRPEPETGPGMSGSASCAPASAAPTCTSSPGTTGRRRREGAAHPGPRVLRRGRRGRRARARRRGRRPRLRRGAHRLRHLPQLPRRPPPDVHPHQGRRACSATARSPSTSSSPRSNVWVHHATSSPRSARSSTRSATRCTPRSRSRWSARTCSSPGCGPIGLMAVAVARHVGARFIVGTDMSPARLELARRWAPTSRWTCRAAHPRGAAAARHARGLRRRASR